MKRFFCWSWWLRVFDRLFARSAVRQAVWLSVAMIVFILLLSFMSKLFSQEENFFSHLRKIVYLFIYPDSFGDLKNTSGGQLWFYSFTLLAGTIIVGGLLISVLTNMLQNRVQRVRDGYVTYHYLSGHILVIGYDEIVPNLVAQICSRYPHRDVVVQSILSAQDVRNAIFAATPDKFEKHIFIYKGRRDSRDDLSRLGVSQAHEIFLIGDRSSNEHDALNMECMTILSRLLGECKKRTGTTHKIPFNVLFEDRATTIAFQTTDIASSLEKYLDLYPLNFYENWCRQALAGEIFDYGRPLVQLDRGSDDENDKSGITADSERTARLVVVGMSRLGISLGIQAAHMMHYPNFSHGNGRDSVITFIDLDADVEMRRFMCMHSPFFDVQTTYYTDLSDSGSGERQTLAPKRYSGTDADFVGVRFEFVKGDIYSTAVRDLLNEWALDRNLSLTIAICLNHSRLNAGAGLSLPQSLYDLSRNIPILVQQRTSGALLSTLRADQNNRFCNVIPFGMIDCSYDLDHQIERMAMQLNYEYRNVQIKQKPLYDDVEGFWNELSVSEQWSNIHAVTFIFTKLRSLGVPPKKVYSKAKSPEAVNVFTFIFTKLRSLVMSLKAKSSEAKSSEAEFLEAKPPEAKSYEAEFLEAKSPEPESSEAVNVFSDEQTALACEIEHRRWTAERLLLGYSRCEEPVKRAPQTHHCIAPYNVVKEFDQPRDENGIGQNELNYRATLKAIREILKIITENAEKRSQADLPVGERHFDWGSLTVSKFNPFHRREID